MRLCYVRDIYLFINFPTQPHLLLFLVYGDAKHRLYQLFRFSMKLIHMHYNWQQNRIEKTGDMFQSVPTQLRDAS